MMGWDDGGWGVGDWVAMGLMMLVFWGLLAVLVVWLVRSSSGKPGGPVQQQNPPSPDVVLADRFARGEINEDEFTRRRELLRGTQSTPTLGGE